MFLFAGFCRSCCRWVFALFACVAWLLCFGLGLLETFAIDITMCCINYLQFVLLFGLVVLFVCVCLCAFVGAEMFCWRGVCILHCLLWRAAFDSCISYVVFIMRLVLCWVAVCLGVLCNADLCLICCFVYFLDCVFYLCLLCWFTYVGLRIMWFVFYMII